MGGKSSSSSTTQNFTDASTVNAAQTGSAAAITGEGNTAVVNLLDGGAIDASFGLGSESLDFANDSLEILGDGISETLDFSGSVVGSSLDVVNSVVDEGFDFGGDSLDFADRSLSKSFEFGADSTDQAFAFSSAIVEQSSLENRAILGAAINASNDAQSSVLGFAKSVSAPQTDILKTVSIGLVVLGIAFAFNKSRG